jgi:hypothetical protein
MTRQEQQNLIAQHATQMADRAQARKDAASGLVAQKQTPDYLSTYRRRVNTIQFGAEINAWENIK